MKNHYKVVYSLIALIVSILILCISFKWSAIQEMFIPLKYHTGKDTILMLGDGKFEIGKFGKMDILQMNTKDGLALTVLNDVVDFKKSNGILYVVSSRGYAVINANNNHAQVFYTATIAEKDTIESLKNIDEISILNSYNNFSSRNRKILNKIIKK